MNGWVTGSTGFGKDGNERLETRQQTPAQGTM